MASIYVRVSLPPQVHFPPPTELTPFLVEFALFNGLLELPANAWFSHCTLAVSSFYVIWVDQDLTILYLVYLTLLL